MAQANLESVHSKEGVLGPSVDLLVDAQQICTDILGPIADKRLVATDPDILAFAELQTVSPNLLKNPRRKARSVRLAPGKHSD